MWRPGKILKGCGYKNTMACTLRYKLPSRFHTDSVQVTNSQTDEFRKQKAGKQTHLNSPVALKTRRKKMNLEHEISTKGHRSRWLDILAANRDFRRPSTSRWACLKRKWGGGRVEVGWQKQKEEEREREGESVLSYKISCDNHMRHCQLGNGAAFVLFVLYLFSWWRSVRDKAWI